ncbi:hypothetical protein FXF51_17485 [Nonomuraea sp. PA05]|uniref:hypothetical protein n=1 Tax=Nonomuraea sp. PA05 TaxID=2604466 RepID=UPI0011DC20E3|nr:hypothetical protein [Nonomuraea sp. PA05]TYB65994.1 hypothetical protein FXF51_17485 [Nonomuraea sp. PA05]
MRAPPRSPDGDSTAYDQMTFHTDTRFSGCGGCSTAAGRVVSEKKLDAKTRKAVIKAGHPESGPF